MNNVISNSVRHGQQRRAEEKGGVNTRKGVYSVKYTENLRNFANSFAKFMNREFPEVRYLKDIKIDHFQRYIDQNLKNSNFSIRTAKGYTSYMSKIGEMSKGYFKNCHLPDFKNEIVIPKTVTEEKLLRNVPMREQDFQKLEMYMRGHNSCAKFVPSMVVTCGLRTDEISFVRPEHIRFNRDGSVVVEVHNPKGGRYREITVDRERAGIWREVVEHAERHGWETLTEHYNTEAVQKALRRGMKAVGISEKYPRQANHAIRKLFAVRLFKDYLSKGMDEKRAWGFVSTACGHGFSRADLKQVYLEGTR